MWNRPLTERTLSAIETGLTNLWMMILEVTIVLLFIIDLVILVMMGL